MALDTLIVGPFVFDGFAPPDQMPFGGKQQVVVHKTPGGGRTVDVMGPDDHDPKWNGILYGETAFSDMLTLDALRKSGQELPFSWGAESRTVVITDFEAKVEKPNYIHYEIGLIYTDDSGSAGSIATSVTSMVLADLLSAVSF